jgi:hypothetical protein
MCLANFLFRDILRRAWRPGFAPVGEAFSGSATTTGREWPGGHFLSFASPKERKQRKGEPTVCVPQRSYGQPAVLAAGGCPLELATLKQSRALIHLQLRSSAQPEGQRTSRSTRLAALRATLPNASDWWHAQTFLNRWLSKLARAKQSAAVLAAVEAGLSSAAAGGSGLALFERSEFSQTPPDASSARNRAADLPSARFFFGYLLLAKQKKVTRLPGRDPACLRHQASDAIQQTNEGR